MIENKEINIKTSSDLPVLPSIFGRQGPEVQILSLRPVKSRVNESRSNTQTDIPLTIPLSNSEIRRDIF